VLADGGSAARRDGARGLFSLGLPEYLQILTRSARPTLNLRFAAVTHD